MKNLRETPYGWQKYTRVKGRLKTEHTTDKPTPAEVTTWIHLQHARIAHPLEVSTASTEGPTFEEDARAYLASVTSMRSYSDRDLHMREWAATFRGRHRNHITPIQIRTRLEQLRSEGYAPSSVNKRRTALMHFYTVTNLRSGYNPVRDVPAYPEEEEPRAQSLWTIYRILALMAPSQTRARLRVMVWTGWPQAQLQRLKPSHLDLDNARAFVTPRRKGKGRKGVWLPLLPGAVIALKDFVKWDCFTKPDAKPFSVPAMWTVFGRALAKLNRRRVKAGKPPLDVRPYDIRHSFGTWAAERLTDERALQELLMHANPKRTRRYTDAATESRVVRAVARLAELTNR